MKRGITKSKQKAFLGFRDVPFGEIPEEFPKQKFQNLCSYLCTCVQVAKGKHLHTPCLVSFPSPFVPKAEPKFHQSYQNHKCHSLGLHHRLIILQIKGHMCQMGLLDEKH